MDRVVVHDRVERRHPELSIEDVKHAWEHAICSTPRLGKNPDEYVALGFDSNGRLVEMVAIRDSKGDWVVFHAMTPPSSRTYSELGVDRR